MDIFDELENMALNATSYPNKEPEVPSKDTICRWEKLFGYSHADAVNAIEQHRGSLSRKRIGDEHWELVRDEKKAQGYDREAYEHELEIGGRTFKPDSARVNGATSQRMEKERYIVKLEEDVTPDAIKEPMGLTEKPEVMEGSGEDGNGDARFCVVGAATRQALLDRFSTTRFRPTFVRVTRPAEKDLSSDSRYPTLGVDTTLLTHRSSARSGTFIPAQNEFPV